jgi:hypothetical protein
MLSPITVEMSPITMMIAIQRMTWIATMARSAIFVFIAASPVRRESIFVATNIDQVFTLRASESNRMCESMK